MTHSIPAALRVIAVGAASCAVLVGVGNAAIATAEPAPDCTAANLARVSAGVSNATADYLDANAAVNAFFTGLKGQGPELLASNVENYLNSYPQVRDDLQGIRQPLAEFETRCA